MVFTGVISLIRAHLKQGFCSFSETLTPTLITPLALNLILTKPFKLGSCLENIQVIKMEHRTTEECDCHIITWNMSGNTTSYSKRKQETTEQCNSHLKEA